MAMLYCKKFLILSCVLATIVYHWNGLGGSVRWRSLNQQQSPNGRRATENSNKGVSLLEANEKFWPFTTKETKSALADECEVDILFVLDGISTRASEFAVAINDAINQLQTEFPLSKIGIAVAENTRKKCFQLISSLFKPSKIVDEEDIPGPRGAMSRNPLMVINSAATDASVGWGEESGKERLQLVVVISEEPARKTGVTFTPVPEEEDYACPSIEDVTASDVASTLSSKGITPIFLIPTASVRKRYNALAGALSGETRVLGAQKYSEIPTVMREIIGEKGCFDTSDPKNLASPTDKKKMQVPKGAKIAIGATLGLGGLALAGYGVHHLLTKPKIETTPLVKPLVPDRPSPTYPGGGMLPGMSDMDQARASGDTSVMGSQGTESKVSAPVILGATAGVVGVVGLGGYAYYRYRASKNTNAYGAAV